MLDPSGCCARALSAVVASAIPRPRGALYQGSVVVSIGEGVPRARCEDVALVFRFFEAVAPPLYYLGHRTTQMCTDGAGPAVLGCETVPGSPVAVYPSDPGIRDTYLRVAVIGRTGPCDRPWRLRTAPYASLLPSRSEARSVWPRRESHDRSP